MKTKNEKPVKTNVTVKSRVKAGAIVVGKEPEGTMNHSRAAVKVKSGVKAGISGPLGGWQNHSRAAVKVKSSVKAGLVTPPGGIMQNHNRVAVKVKSGVKAGGWSNHNRTALTIARA